MVAEVAYAGCAQQRVGDGVGNDVGIAVTDEPAGARELDSSEDEPPTGVIADGVDIETHAHADGHERRS